MNDFDTAPAPAETEHVAEAPQVEDSTPPEPVEPQPERARTAREALEKAFSNEEPEEAKDEPQEPENGPARGPDGKFVAKDQAAQTEAAKEEAKKPEGEAASFAEAPSRFSSDAKQAWAQAPESVRAEIHRMQRELEAGLQQKDAQLEPLKPFFKMAEQHNVDLAQTLGRYVQMEQLLARDPRRGVETLARNFGMSLDQFIGQIQGKGEQQGQQQGQPDPRDRHIQQLTSTVQQLQQQLGQVSQTVGSQQEQAVQRQIDEFASQPGRERFDELADDIAHMITTGFATDLADAYDKADRLKPAAPAPTPEPTPAPPAAQTRQPRSLTGAPSPGSDPKMNRTPSKSPREALSRAFGV